MVGNRAVVYLAYHDDVVGGQRTDTLAHDEQWKQVKSSAHGQGSARTSSTLCPPRFVEDLISLFN